MKPATTERQPKTGPIGYTKEQLDDLAFHLPHVKAWIKAVEDRLQRALEDGMDLKNVTLERTQARRKWREEGEALIKLLRKFSKLDVVAPRTPLSPAGLEKILGKKLFAAKVAEFTVKESSGMKLAFTHEDTEKEEEQ